MMDSLAGTTWDGKRLPFWCHKWWLWTVSLSTASTTILHHSKIEMNHSIVYLRMFSVQILILSEWSEMVRNDLKIHWIKYSTPKNLFPWLDYLFDIQKNSCKVIVATTFHVQDVSKGIICVQERQCNALKASNAVVLLEGQYVLCQWPFVKYH